MSAFASARRGACSWGIRAAHHRCQLDLAAGEIPIIGKFLCGVLYGGLYLVYLKRIRARKLPWARRSRLQGKFSEPVSGGLVTSVLSFLSICLCVVPYIYLTVAWIFAFALVIDKRLEFWTAMELSRTVRRACGSSVRAGAHCVRAYLLCEGYAR